MAFMKPVPSFGMVEERATRSVFVGNIPYEATEEALKEVFNQAGPVLSFRLVYDRETGKPKGYGFCEYQDTETAQSAMRNLNNYDFNGRQLRVGIAAGEQDKVESKSMQQALGGPPAESVYGDPVEPERTPEIIARAVGNLPPEQMYELVKQMKNCMMSNPNEARNMLLQNPQLAYALLQAQIVMKVIEPEIALTMFHRPGEPVGPLLPPMHGPGGLHNQPMPGHPGGFGPRGPSDLDRIRMEMEPEFNMEPGHEFGSRGPMGGPRPRGGLLGDMPPGARRDVHSPSLMGAPRGPLGPMNEPRPNMGGPRMGGARMGPGPGELGGQDMREFDEFGPRPREMMGGPRMGGPMEMGGPRMSGPMGMGGPRMGGPMEMGGPRMGGPIEMGGPRMGSPRDMGGPGPRDIGGPGPRDIGGTGQRDMGGPGQRDIGGPMPRDMGGLGPRELGGLGPRDMPRDMGGPSQRDMGGPMPRDMSGPMPRDMGGPGPRELIGGPASREPGFSRDGGPRMMGGNGAREFGPDTRDPMRFPGQRDINSPSLSPRAMACGPGPREILPRDASGSVPRDLGGPRDMLVGPRNVSPHETMRGRPQNLDSCLEMGQGLGRDVRDISPARGPGFSGPGSIRAGAGSFPNTSVAPVRQLAPSAALSPVGGGSGGPAISQQDQEKAQLIMQVLQLSDEQIAMLPNDQRQSILILKEQIAQSAGQSS